MWTRRPSPATRKAEILADLIRPDCDLMAEAFPDFTIEACIGSSTEFGSRLHGHVLRRGGRWGLISANFYDRDYSRALGELGGPSGKDVPTSWADVALSRADRKAVLDHGTWRNVREQRQTALTLARRVAMFAESLFLLLDDYEKRSQQHSPRPDLSTVRALLTVGNLEVGEIIEALAEGRFPILSAMLNAEPVRPARYVDEEDRAATEEVAARFDEVIQRAWNQEP